MSSQMASFMAADWSLILIGIMPGESSNSKSLPKRTHLQKRRVRWMPALFLLYNWFYCNHHLYGSRNCFVSCVHQPNAIWDLRGPTVNIIWNCFSKYWFDVLTLKLLVNKTYFSSLVTPGLGAAAHIRRLSNRFINEDLPTFGYPTIPARTCK